MSKQLNRKVLQPNNGQGVKSEFAYNANLGFKSKASPSIVTWASRGKGVQGEEVNATNNAARSIVNRNWKPLQS